MSPKVNAGLDDSNFSRLYTVNYVDLEASKAGHAKQDTGKFMVTFTRGNDIQEYPSPAKDIVFKYDLKDEL